MVSESIFPKYTAHVGQFGYSGKPALRRPAWKRARIAGSL
jgi:hypothetical protein